MSIGKSMRIFLSDGTPGGLLTVEIMNWTGHVVAAPRSELAQLVKRDEARKTGVYILLGDDPERLGGQMAYIGESDQVGNRLRDHAGLRGGEGKDFWDRALVLTSKDENLTKAHVRYLESRFIQLADEAQRARLDNGTRPSDINLPESDKSDMEYFIDQIQIVLPVLGVNILRAPATRLPASPREAGGERPESPLFEMTMSNVDVAATAREVDGEFTVLEGSRARASWVGVDGHSYTALHQELEKDGTLVPEPDGSSMRFTRNRVFTSPSAAAAMVAGRVANGRTDWRVQGTGQTYGQWELQGVEENIGSSED